MAMPLYGPKADDEKMAAFEKAHPEAKTVFCIHTEGSPLENSDVLTKTHKDCSPSSNPDEATNYGHLRLDTPCEIEFEGKKYGSIQDVWEQYFTMVLQKNLCSYKEYLEFLLKVINYRWLHDSGFRNVFNLKSPSEMSTCNAYIYEADHNDIYHKISVWHKDTLPPSLHIYPILGIVFIETTKSDAPFIPWGLNFVGLAMTIVVNYYRKNPESNMQLTENNCITAFKEKIYKALNLSDELRDPDHPDYWKHDDGPLKDDDIVFGSNTLMRI